MELVYRNYFVVLYLVIYYFLFLKYRRAIGIAVRAIPDNIHRVAVRMTALDSWVLLPVFGTAGSSGAGVGSGSGDSL